VEAFLAGVRVVVAHLVRLRIAAANDVIRVCFIIYYLFVKVNIEVIPLHSASLPSSQSTE
jgi:hypothetical protein